ncbi:MAG: FHIPEP family type III secretion protein, partial [SAR324 cluster bacterium]|nr:FHIPEP family type III secretion protein [SAR324 cluster bacterium]
MALGSNSISLNGLSKNSDALLAIGVVGVLMILVVPLPEVVLDLLIALSITVGVLILFVSLFTANALEFSSFPTV